MGRVLNLGAMPVHHVAMDHRGAIAVLLAVIAVATPAGIARAATVDMEVAFDVGYVPKKVHGSTAVPIPGATTPDGRPAGILGDQSVNISGLALGGNAALKLPNFGPGLPRVFFFGDAMFFLGRKGEGRFNLYDTTPGAADTGLTVRRNFVLDVGLGGIWAFCREPSCLDLRIFIGATFLHQTITAEVDETSVGGRKEELSGSKMKPSAMIGALVSIPLGTALRLQLGFIFRSISSVSNAATSSQGRTYTTTIDGAVDPQLTAGLAFPFAL